MTDDTTKKPEELKHERVGFSVTIHCPGPVDEGVVDGIAAAFKKAKADFDDHQRAALRFMLGCPEPGDEEILARFRSDDEPEVHHCRDCRHWLPYTSYDGSEVHGMACTSPEVAGYIDEDGTAEYTPVFMPPADFGCVHWEEKK